MTGVGAQLSSSLWPPREMRGRSGRGGILVASQSRKDPEPFTDGEMGAQGGEQSQRQSFPGCLSLLPDQGWSSHNRPWKECRGGCEHRLWTQTQSCRLGQDPSTLRAALSAKCRSTLPCVIRLPRGTAEIKICGEYLEEARHILSA